jgi:hypothetical protein
LTISKIKIKTFARVALQSFGEALGSRCLGGAGGG